MSNQQGSKKNQQETILPTTVNSTKFRKTFKNNLLSLKRIKNVHHIKYSNENDSNSFELFGNSKKLTQFSEELIEKSIHLDNHDDNNLNVMDPSSSAQTPDSQSVLIHKSLRFKITIILILLFLLLMATCLAILLTAFNISFLSVENSMAMESAKRTSRTLFDDFYFLTSRLFEYGAFKDAIDVVTNTNSNATVLANQFLNYYLHCQYQLTSRVNFALIYYMNGTYLSGLGCFDGYRLDKIPNDLINLQASSIGRVLMDGMSNPSTRNVGFYSPSESLFDLIVSNITVSGLNQNFNITTQTKLLNLLLLSAMPIQDTDYQKTYGIMIFGRYQTREFFTDMSDRSQYCLTPYNLRSSRDRYLFAKSLSSDKSKTELTSQQTSKIISEKTSSWTQTLIEGVSSQSLWSNNTGQFIQQFSVDENDLNLPLFENRLCSNKAILYGSKISIFQEYYDLISDGSMVIRTDFDREVYTLGITSFLITWSVMTVMIILLSIGLIIFLEIVVLKRLLKLTNAVRIITNSTNIKERVPNVGSDELGMLCEDVNNMLDALDATQTILSEDNELMQRLLEKTSLSEQKSRVIMNSIDDFIFSVDSKTAQIVNFNTIFESRILKKQFNLVSQYLQKAPLMDSQNNGSDMAFLYNSIENPNHLNDEILKYLENMAETKSRWDTTILSNLGSEIPVSVSTSKVDIMLDEGNIHQVYVIVARNMSEQVELRQAVKVQEQRMQDFKLGMEFERVMMNSNGREMFKECSEENILFLEDILLYKSIKKTSDRAKKQAEILNKYLCDNSPYAINISQKVREKEVKNIAEGYGQIDLFISIEKVVKSMLLKDTFLRFSLQYDLSNDQTLLSSCHDNSELSSSIESSLDSPSILSSASLISSTREIIGSTSPPRFHSLWKNDELPQVDSNTSSTCSSPVTTPRSHHKRLNAIHGGLMSPTSPNTSSYHHKNDTFIQSSPPKHFEINSKDNCGPDLSHRKEMLKKGTRIPLSLLASFDNYDNLKRRRSSSLAAEAKNNITECKTPKSISMPSSPFQIHSVDFNSIDHAETTSHYSITVTNSNSIPSSPSTPPRPQFAKSYSASFLDFRVNSPPAHCKKRPSAVKVETLSPNRTKLKPVFESSLSSPNIFCKSPSSFQSNVKAFKSKLNASQNSHERDLLQIHDYKSPLFV
ncbi:RGS domain-containing protein [Naegleria gruberi]|uniref:RGS domain-containing protein n=1 Tax=Naegleria gruberi TaxID=5762 RepID=D2VY64_NAEGR|nr:RGS domain-containing protein [Naegleria gruberi]EFC38310.1 RGS domain-containing protein [Naegleria gruberi]|eukprot:XP_002671054.1 RGS domain-containing protein [Naegleria gruberi strain NEG-M]